MAAKTPDNIYNDVNMGSVNLVRAVFSTTNLDDADTWTSGLTNVVDFWFQGKNNPTTQASTGINIAFVASTGVFTFYPGEDNTEGTLFILRRGN